MPDVKIIKLKIRRGTNAQRKNIVLEQGELGYTIDTKRVYIGDGIINGGRAVGSINHLPVTSSGGRVNLNAEVGDIVSDSSIIYQLTGSDASVIENWAPLTSLLGNIADNSIGGTKFAPSAAFSQGGLIATSQNGLSANVDSNTVVITSNTIRVGTINENNISSSSFGNGIVGGDGQKIRINANTSSFGYNSGVLSLTAIPAGLVSFAAIDQDIIGPGLVYNIGTEKIENIIHSVDSNNLFIDNSVLKFVSLPHNGGESIFSSIIFNEFGQITSTESLIQDTLSGNSVSNPYFNGIPDQTVYTNQTLYDVVSSSEDEFGDDITITQQLTSAGFIVVDLGLDSPFAIPVFRITDAETL
jgi:hypothetical protein